MSQPQVTEDVSSLNQKITELQHEVETFDGKRNFFMAIYKTKEDEASKVTEQLTVCQHEKGRLENDIKAIRTQQADMKTEHMITCMQKDDQIQELKLKHRHEMTSLHKSMQGIMSEADNSKMLKSRIRSLEQELDVVKNSLRGRLEADSARVKASAAHYNDPPLPPRQCISSLCKEKRRNLQIQLDDAHRKLQKTADSAAQAAVPKERDLFNVGDQLKAMEEKIRTQSSAIKDLESFSSVLQRQKENAQRDLIQIRVELTESLTLLERERKENTSLTKTWQMANDQFLQSQRLMMADIERFQSVLNEEQTFTVREMEAADSDREAQRARIDELDKRRKEQLELLEQQGISLLDDGSIRRTQSNTSLASSDVYGQFEKAESVASGHVPDVFIGQSQSQTGPIQKGLTADMQQALDAPFPEDVENKRVLASMKTPNSTELHGALTGTRQVSEEEWLRLEQELAATRKKIQKPCENCVKYDKQIKLEKRRFSDLNDRYKAAQIQIKSGQKSIEELESHLKVLGHTCQQQIVAMEEQSIKTQEDLFVLNEQFRDSVHEFQSRILSLTSERKDTLKQLRSVEKEHEELMNIKSRAVEDILPDNMQLPEGSTELHQAVLDAREELVKARTAYNYLKQKSEGDALLLRDERYAERLANKTELDELAGKVLALQEEKVRLLSMESEMTREASLRQQLAEQLSQVSTKLEKSAIREKHLKQQVQQLLTEMTSLKEEKARLLERVRALQTDLSDSEQVQKDFVSLSQQLQIQLEQIRQAEHEVRFEFPEDIKTCQACKKNLQHAREKHNCMHCGKVYCVDCSSNRIPSGPTRRLARVCNVCHTILDNEAAPFFSTNQTRPA